MNDIQKQDQSPLFQRVVSILEQARSNVVRTVNAQMVAAYWLIGREIVEEEQQGEVKAAYGKRLIEELSSRLTEHYGKGFSTTNLKYFRIFYLAFPDRSVEIGHPAGDELAIPGKSEPRLVTLPRPQGDCEAAGAPRAYGGKPQRGAPSIISWAL